VDVHDQGRRLLDIQSPRITVSFPKTEATDKGNKRKSPETNLQSGSEWISTKSGKKVKNKPSTVRVSNIVEPRRSNEIITLLDSDDDNDEGDTLEVLPKRARRLSADDARRSISAIATRSSDDIDSESENEFE
jgi:hypothetical protein